MARRKASPVGCVFLGIGLLWISSKCGGQATAPSPPPRPVYQRAPTAAELAADRAQAAAMEAKARKEEAEVRAYQKQQQEQAENQAAEDRLNNIRNQQYQAQQPQSQAPQYQAPANESGYSGSRLSPGDYEMHTGPKGGRYHLSANGNKVYERRK